MKHESETLERSKEYEQRIKELEKICIVKGTKCEEFIEMEILTRKFNNLTIPKKHYPNTNTNQLIK